jgi:hypothetical protein
VPTEHLTTGVPAAIARYAATVHAGVPTEHHVVSPLGAWLVLALAGLAGEEPADRGTAGADSAARSAVEHDLGLPVTEAGQLAIELLGAPHPAVAAAVGLWWRQDVRTDRLSAYAERLPSAATREPLAGQQVLDAWARDHTLGLIDRFPIRVTPDLLLVLASALATKVRWQRRFDVVPASELAVRGHPGGFADAVSRALRSVQGHDVRLVDTVAAGLVGVHVAASADGLAVVSVLGSGDADRAAVIAAGHEVALGLQGTRVGNPISLFDVPAGRSDLGEIIEDTVPTKGGSGPLEEGVGVLPAWRASTDLDLLAGPTADGLGGAGRLLAALLPPGPTALEARQVAVASYTREGFEAAAVTGMAVRATALAGQPREVLRRRLTLRFDRPYAAVAVAVDPPATSDSEKPAVAPAWFGVPVFSAWVAEPSETAPEPGQQGDGIDV